MFKSYTLFRQFIYPTLLLPLRLYSSWNTLHDSIGHNHNLVYIFAKDFSLKIIYEYIYQTDIDYTPYSVIKHWHRIGFNGATIGEGWDSVKFLRKVEYNIENRMNELREFRWNSWDIVTLDDWISYFDVYMDDFATAFNTCLVELESMITSSSMNSSWDSGILHYNFDASNEGNQWPGRINFSGWVEGNEWFYGLSNIQGNELSELRTELMASAYAQMGIDPDEEEE